MGSLENYNPDLIIDTLELKIRGVEMFEGIISVVMVV